MTTRRLLFLVSLLIVNSGCIELRDALSGLEPGGDAGGSLPLGGCVPDGGDGSPDLPVVTLSVSNPNPQAREEVLLTCSLVEGSAAEATFDFQPAEPRLIVNEWTGRAYLIVDESDVGSELTFTCTATTEAGTSAPSNEAVILPGG